MVTVGVAIGTFGEFDTWAPFAQRAIRSIDRQTVLPRVAWVHSTSLAAARNEAVQALDAEWVVICDADDELDRWYIESMLAADGEIRRPATLGVYDDGREDDEPVMIPVRDLRVANYIVIGAMFSRQMFLDINGFDESLPCIEDWDLWQRLVRHGARVVDVPNAIYRVHVRNGSRNQNTSQHAAAYRTIRAKHTL
jgi:GT2 family glycosyltransferase